MSYLQLGCRKSKLTMANQRIDTILHEYCRSFWQCVAVLANLPNDDGKHASNSSSSQKFGYHTAGRPEGGSCYLKNCLIMVDSAVLQ